MPDFSMWSPAESGTRLAEQDTLQKYAMQVRTQHEAALAQEAQARAQEQQRVTAAMMSLKTPDGKGGPGAGGSLADILEDQAVQLSRLGLPSKAGDIGAKAAAIRLHEAQQSHQEEAAAKLGFEVKAKTLDRIASAYGQARNERDWAAANMMIAQQFPEFDNPLAKVPYSPEAAQAAANQALSIKDKLALQIKQRTADSEDSLRRSRQTYLANRTDILQRQAADRERRTDILEKNGGKAGKDKPVGSPSPGETKAAGNLLKTEFPNLPKEERDNAAFTIASEAKRLAKSNPGLSMGDAMQRALAASKAAGDFQTTDGLLGQFKKTTFSQAGKTPETALPAPKDPKTAQFQAGKYYQTPKGVMRFDGKGWHPTEVTSRAAPSADVPDDGEDE